MPMFVYEGQALSLRVSGQLLVRGRPTELSGNAAKSAAAYAEKHPTDLREVDGSGDKPAKAKRSGGGSKALEERQALVARAKELGIPAKGKSDQLKAAIAEAEAAAKAAD